MVSLSDVSSGDGAPGTLSMGRSLVDNLISGKLGAPTKVNP